MTLRILINGALGHMGRVLAEQASNEPDKYFVAGGVDDHLSGYSAPLYTDIFKVDSGFDVLIDFSVPAASLKAVSYCIDNNKPCVIATTGFNEQQKLHIQNASNYIPVFYTGNMSLGVNLQQALVKKAAAVLCTSFDAEIIETHHKYKKDAPSGTALMLAEAVKSGMSSPAENKYGRHGIDCLRQSGEIGIHSLRGGTLPGEHTVRFLGQDEELSITHRTYSKAVFAKGALKAAEFILHCHPGLYDMADLLG